MRLTWKHFRSPLRWSPDVKISKISSVLKYIHIQSAACPTHLTWEKIFPSRTSVPPLPTEPLPQRQYGVWTVREECLKLFFNTWVVVRFHIVDKTHTGAQKLWLKVLSKATAPSVKWYGPKAGSTVSVSHGDQSALPAKKTAVQRLITCCIQCSSYGPPTPKSADNNYLLIWPMLTFLNGKHLESLLQLSC